MYPASPSTGEGCDPTGLPQGAAVPCPSGQDAAYCPSTAFTKIAAASVKVTSTWSPTPGFRIGRDPSLQGPDCPIPSNSTKKTGNNPCSHMPTPPWPSPIGKEPLLPAQRAPTVRNLLRQTGQDHHKVEPGYPPNRTGRTEWWRDSEPPCRPLETVVGPLEWGPPKVENAAAAESLSRPVAAENRLATSAR